MKRLFSVLLAACLLLAAALPVLAAEDPNVFESRGVYIDGDEKENPFHTTVTFDPASGRLTIDEDKGNILSINYEADLINWIKTVADGVKTVYITKYSYLSHFTNDEHVLAAYPFHHAFAYLSNLERFEVEEGNEELVVKDGVLYTRNCFSLVHYPAAKPDKTYVIDEFCMEGLEPYAFCNTRYLERLEFPSARSSLNYFSVEEYSLSAVDLDTLEPQTSSIKQMVVYWYSAEQFDYVFHFRDGNNAADQAEIIFEKPNAVQDIVSFFRVTILSYFRMMLNMIRLMFQP